MAGTPVRLTAVEVNAVEVEICTSYDTAPAMGVQVKMGVLEIPVALSAGNCRVGTDKMLPPGGTTGADVVNEKTLDQGLIPPELEAFTPIIGCSICKSA